MSVVVKQVKVYVRIAVMALVAGAVALVLFKNRGNTVRFWFFGFTDETREIHVIWLLLVAAVASLLVWWVFTLGVGLLRDMRDVRRAAASHERDQALRKREIELDEREQRVDGKIKEALTSEHESGDA